MREIGLLLVTDESGIVTLAEGTAMAEFAVPSDAVGRTLADVCQAWPRLVKGMTRAQAGHDSKVVVVAEGAEYDVCFRPRRSGAGALLPAGALLLAQRREPDEAEIARSEARLAEAQRIAHVGSWEWDVQSDTVTWTDELYRIYGLEPRSKAGNYQGFLARVVPEDRAHTEATVRRALEQYEPFEYDHRIVRTDGAVRMLHTRGAVVLSSKGVVLRLGGTCWDVTELSQAAEERDRATSLLRATLEATADGLLVVDLQGRIAAYNQRLLELWNLPADVVNIGGEFEQLLQTVDAQLEPENARACLQRVRQLEVDREAESFDSLVFLDGRYFERYSRPQRVGDQIVGRVWSYRNVTERERSLHDARRALAVRDEFLSVVTHEVRGPIASLHLASQSLRRGVAEPARERLFDVIEREGRRVARFLDELVDLARIRSGQLAYTLTAVDLLEVVREAVARSEPDAAKAGCRVSILANGVGDGQAEAPVLGRWDRGRIDQIVTNLLSNAIKFGRQRPIEVRVESRSGVARLVIHDQGIGIGEAERSRLFTPFERAVSPRQYGGLGLGLYIVRTLVEGMGGTVRLESQVDVGTTVTVELPVTGASS